MNTLDVILCRRKSSDVVLRQHISHDLLMAGEQNEEGGERPSSLMLAATNYWRFRM